MIITGIAHCPERLHERGNLPSPDMVFLAKQALKEYHAAYLVTSLAPGWEQALAKAARELEIPYQVAIPYAGRDSGWTREERAFYYDLLARAEEVYQVSTCPGDEAIMEANRWRIDRAEVVLGLWDYEFAGETYAAMTYALENEKQVVNLYEEWRHLYSLRRRRTVMIAPRQKFGAQAFEKKTE